MKHDSLHLFLKFGVSRLDDFEGYNPIQEHIRIDQEKGKVIWGHLTTNSNLKGFWDKKIKVLDEGLNKNGIAFIFFCDPTEELLYVARYIKTYKKDEIEQGNTLIQYIPDYYKDKVGVPKERTENDMRSYAYIEMSGIKQIDYKQSEMIFTDKPDTNERVLDNKSMSSKFYVNIDERLFDALVTMYSKSEMTENKISVVNVMNYKSEDEKEDYINIEEDAKLFSSLFSSDLIKPPLSVGLFGEWGSGKSFFMNQVDKYLVQSKSCDKGVIRVSFNAWEYIDSNIWVSVMTKIYSELSSHFEKDTDEKKKEKRYKSLLESSSFYLQEKETYEYKMKTYSTKISSKKKEVKELKESMGAVANISKLYEIFYGGPIAEDKKNLTPEAFTKRLKDIEKNSHTHVKRLEFALKYYVKNYKWVHLIALLLITIFILTYKSTHFIKYLSSGLAYVGVIYNALKPGFKEIMKTFEDLQSKVGDFGKFISALEEYENKQSKLTKLEKELEDLNSKSATVKEEYKLLESDEFLKKYYSERSKDPLFSKHLGIIHEIKKDIQVLTDKKDDLKINRIILFIDDLDRCPAEKVVDVLQAVHVLLATELFVVVLAADTRWISECLEVKYEKVFSQKKANESYAYAHNYLEKIIQIPFWVEKMDEDMVNNYLDGLLGVKMEDHNEANNTSEEGPYSGPLEDGAGNKSMYNNHALNIDTVPKADVEEQVEVPYGERVEYKLVEFTADELNRIKAFSKLMINRTPREIKRLVNCLYLVKNKFLNLDSERFGLAISLIVLNFFSDDFGRTMNTYLEAIQNGQNTEQIVENLKENVSGIDTEFWKEIADDIGVSGDHIDYQIMKFVSRLSFAKEYENISETVENTVNVRIVEKSQ